jgi:hypothetical protein
LKGDRGNPFLATIEQIARSLENCGNPIGEHRHATSPQAIRAFGGSGRHYSRTATHGNGR